MIHMWQKNTWVFNPLLQQRCGLSYNTRKWWENWICLLLLPVLLLVWRLFFFLFECLTSWLSSIAATIGPLSLEWSHHRIRMNCRTWFQSPLHRLIRSFYRLISLESEESERFSRKTLLIDHTLKINVHQDFFIDWTIGLQRLFMKPSDIEI